MNWPYIDTPEPETLSAETQNPASESSNPASEPQDLAPEPQDLAPEPQDLAPELEDQIEEIPQIVDPRSAAEIYEALFSEVTDRAIEPLLDAAGVSFGTRLLDVACGPGRLLGEAVRRGASAAGVDLAPEMVVLARSAHPKLDIREGNAESLSYAVASFDAVTCAFGIGHFPEPERAMSEFARVLVPYGIAAVAWWGSFARNRINGLFHEAIGKLAVNVPAAPPIDQFSDRERLTALMQSAGLGTVRIEEVAFQHTFRDATELWNMAMGSFARASAVIKAQPEDVQQAIREAVDAAAQQYASREGLSIPVVFMVAAGVKP
jgi:ubiquinone/menaquinone biosynthesis C-methylase UbiE